MSLAALAVGPAFAAAPVAQASATALTVSVAGNGTDSGTFTATHDGTRQTTSGTRSPAVTTAGGQRLTNVGTLAQDATTSVDGASRVNGSSAACAGVAGEGATVLQAGDGTSCLAGGRTITLDAAHLDLADVRPVTSDALGDALDDIAPSVTSVILGPLSSALATTLRALGDPGVYVDLGAVQAACTAGPGGARGSATVADASAYVRLPGIGRVDLVRLPVHPAPDTHVATDLSAVVTAIQDAVDTDIENTLVGLSGQLGPVLAPLQLGLDTLIDQVKANVTDRIGPQLAPLQDNLLDITLNAQSRPAPSAISVTALDLRVLPAARQFVDADLLDLAVGKVTCGPNGRLAPGAVARPKPSVDRPDTAVPVAVTAGADDFESGPGPLALAGLGGLVVAGLTAGVVGFRRSLRP